MPVKKTTTKKTAVKKTVAKKTISKKPAVAKTVTTKGLEKRIDNCVSMLQKKLTFVNKIMELDIIKTILSSGIIEDTNKRVKKNLEQMSQVLGRLSVVFGGIALLMSLSTMGRLFSYFGASYTILMLLNIVYLVIGMVMGFGLIKMKKRVPFFVTFSVLVDLAYIIFASIFWGMRTVSSPRAVIFYIIFMIYVLKNKTLFNK